MKIANWLASRILSAIVKRIPEIPPNAPKGKRPPIWRYTIEDYATGGPYLTRVLLPRIPWLDVRPMIHRFHRPDGDRALHNHPWRHAISIVLAGEYVEERLLDDESRILGGDYTETRVVRWFNHLTDADFHRVTELRGDVWTLFVIGERVQSWGFREDDGSITNWEDYIAARKAEQEQH